MQSTHPGTPLILIGERDQSVRELQRFFLDRAGFAVEFADDGQALFERARLLRPAVVVTEILIPKLDGLSVCRHLREDPLTRGIPVLVFSILAAAGRAGEAGANVFLRKPLVDSIFIAAIQEMVAAAPTDVPEEPWVSK